jgi:16S rRNA (cytosine967-C5)-methyltransferase
VKAFLDTHPNFRVVPARDVLAEQRIDLDTGDFLSLWPHKHGTDGFFAAVLERVPGEPKAPKAVEEAPAE